ncbi:MAG TPA: thioredoxin domain-containing protein, partial [Pyrinomonadaceae bacterium]
QRLRLIILAAALSCAPVALAQNKPATADKNQPQPVPATAPPASAPASVVSKTEDDCGCEVQVLPEVIAEVGDIKVSGKEIEEPIKDRVNALKQQVKAARQHELYLQINTRLLEAEAKRQGKTTAALINDEIVAKVKEPTADEAQVFYNQNKDRIRQEFQAVKQQIIDHLRNERQRDEAKKLADRLRASAQVVISEQPKTASPNATPERSRVLATVNGQPITAGDVEETLRPLIFNVQTDIYKLRKQQLDAKINDLLLERESQMRKITPAALLEAEITAKAKKVTEEEAKAFYEEHKQEIGGEFAQQKERVIAYLQERESRRAEIAFAERLRSASSLKLFLKEPEQPVYQISTDDQPSKGTQSAAVTIVEFIDYQCSSCAATAAVLERLLGEYKDKVRLVVRDFPLEQHGDAFKAAEAAEGAREQGKYWEYSALLMRNQSALGQDQLKAYASQLSLDRKRFDEALDTGKFADKVQRDLRDGIKYGVAGTPALFINGRLIPQTTYETLKAAIDATLKEKAVAKK